MAALDVIAYTNPITRRCVAVQEYVTAGLRGLLGFEELP
jgi:hypothetical protein